MTVTTDNRALVERFRAVIARPDRPNLIAAHVDDVTAMCDALTAAHDRIEALEGEIKRLKNPPERYCAICCHPESNHPHRHQFVERIISKGQPT